jgi:hypothetical protein
MAAVDMAIAQGIVRNYLAVQQADGWIDWKPGLGGQKQGILCLPVLARLSWGIFQYSEDGAFLRDVFTGLMKFFERWLKPDLDKDGDGLPEWQSENQTGYTFTPTFAAWQSWAQGVDIRLVEAPDLLTYLISEARSLKEIAFYLRDSAAEQQLSEWLATLENALETLWTGERYTYRDRDSHVTTSSVTVVKDGRGGDDLIPAETLDPPNRLLVRVSGGVSLVPRITMRLDGLDASSTAVSETASGNEFVWSTGRGVYTSQQVFSQIDRITFEGLSRVYRVDVHTVDTTRADIHGLLPLWAGGLSQPRAVAVLGQLTDPDMFWRASGATMCAASDPNFDPANAEGSGGVWPFWATLMGEALVELGEMERATELVRRLLRTQVTTFKTQQAFYEFYHSDEPRGLGEQHHLSGIVPLHLLLRVLGARIVSAQKVWAGGEYFWDTPTTVRAKGVTVQRSKDGTRIEFPSGHVADLKGDAWQEVTDIYVK